MKKWKLFVLVIWLFFLLFPVIFGYSQSNNGLVFSGLIFNPIDGYSYFAKMQQGEAGAWTFDLPYSPESNNDVYIFTLYALFGHISRISGLCIPFIYHFFRILFSILLFFSLQDLLSIFFKKEDLYYKGAFISLLFGGGLGWIYFLSGELPIDFWVAESFVFLSSFSNPHFVLSLLLMSIFLTFIIRNQHGVKFPIIIFFLSVILASISPFAAIMIGIIFGINIILHREFTKEKIINLVVFGIPTGAIGFYQYLTIRNDPVLNNWNLQNVTQTPSIINLLFSFSPFIIGILFLFIKLWKKKIILEKSTYLLLFWIIFALFMAFIPFNLQRRFLVGIYLPVVIVFWNLLRGYFSANQKKKLKLTIFVLIGLVIPSNLLLFSGSVNAIKNHDPIFFVNEKVVEAIEWLESNAEEESVILANEENGLIIPALARFKVVYGHPFESINAEETRIFVSDFWMNKLSDEQSRNSLETNNVDFIFCEYANNINNCPATTQSLEIIYNAGNIAIFQVEN
ncbi:MAG: hypothetical protein CVU41_02285 [Chloroflexi bacterium HGW-Chloroflexi-3]|nr:MAG: hypothetical protein CVU41_02285 [Chloroflexi bacterium HGW-Chloroflexi-3]